jgi:hypothetical protein
LNLKREKRVEEILLSLKTLDYLSTSQLRRLHNLGGDRNSRRVLSSISEYVSSFRDTENVFYLNKVGRERVGANVVRTKINPVTHYLIRNDFYIAKKPEEFKTEQRIIVGDIKIVADAWIKLGGAYYFLEVDNSQRWIKNEVKLEKYKRLKETGAFQKRYGYFPKIIWVTCSEVRARKLREIDTNVVYLWEELN